MTRPFFDQQMVRLTGLRFVPASLTTHWEALRDLPDAVLEAAVSRAQKTRQDFPTPIELRIDADAVAHRVRESGDDEDRGCDLPAPVALGTLPNGTPVKATREWRYYCEGCGDMGWRSLWCGDRPVPAPTDQDPAATREITKPWMQSQHCGRRGEHGSHEWVTDCACALSNPAILRRKERQQKYAAAAEKKHS